MAGNTPFTLHKNSQASVVEFSRQCYSLMNQQFNIRDQMRKIDLLYQRETDFTKENQRAKLANEIGDADKFQNIVMPIVMPQVESAVTYQASVFLTGTPLFGVVADPQYIDEALQLESVIDAAAIKGGWKRQLLMFLRDGFKYNLAALEISWCNETAPVLETDVNFSGSQARPKKVIWSGPKLRRMNMYNTFYDTRVAPTDIHTKGEFAGYLEIMSRIQLKQFIASLQDVILANVKPAFESGIGTFVSGNSGSIESFYIPQINPGAIINKPDGLASETNWLAWAALVGKEGNIQYKNSYLVTTLYGRILPEDFDIRVPSSSTPQIWKFIIVNNEIIIHAERQTNAHGYIPMLFSQPLEDGLEYQTKSLAQNISPIQSITSALSNSSIAARRRAISDRTIYDPSRIDAKHINSNNPSAKIPVKPAAYGKPLSEAVYAFPFRDDQLVNVTSEIQQYSSMANMISGQNQARQGQFVKGNKTLHEFSDVMAHANARDQMTSILLEDQIFSPLKEILKTDILQYQGATTVVNQSKAKNVKIDPVALREAILNFKLSDGLTPNDKLINSDTLQVGLQVMGSSPQIGAEYNIGGLFSYLMKTQGATAISDFEKPPEQIAYERASTQYNNTIMQLGEQAIKAGVDLNTVKWPPQPTPEQFGYTPAGSQGNSVKSAPQG